MFVTVTITVEYHYIIYMFVVVTVTVTVTVKYHYTIYMFVVVTVTVTATVRSRLAANFMYVCMYVCMCDWKVSCVSEQAETAVINICHHSELYL